MRDLLLLRCPAGGDRTCEAGVECRSGGKAGFKVSWQEVRCLVCGRCVCLHAHLALSAFWLAGIAPRTTPSRHRFADVPACAICILAG